MSEAIRDHLRNARDLIEKKRVVLKEQWREFRPSERLSRNGRLLRQQVQDCAAALSCIEEAETLTIGL